MTDKTRYYLGIDIGGTNTVVAVTDEAHALRSKGSFPTRPERGYDIVISEIGELSYELISGLGLKMSDIGSVGVGSPNVIDGVVENSVNLSWVNVPLKAELERLFGIPVYVDNDANVAAFGEYIAGAAIGASSVLMVTIGTGVGGGFITDGRVYSGCNRAALEVGHMVIYQNGRPCACGRFGCFERYASATGLILTAKEYADAYMDSLLWKLCDGNPERITGKMIFEAMHEGDYAATEAVGAFIRDLSCGIINLINIFQPEVLLIGGGVAEAGDELFEPLIHRVKQEIITRDSSRNTIIKPTKLGSDAGVIGAACLHLENK
ncbi:MAG: ROK family protein [Clostridiales Family XIII bacterium]|jgi:glucokinase|nr:ROK family protein [Clostridiales Family XIII bacterium]